MTILWIAGRITGGWYDSAYVSWVEAGNYVVFSENANMREMDAVRLITVASKRSKQPNPSGIGGKVQWDLQDGWQRSLI